MRADVGIGLYGERGNERMTRKSVCRGRRPRRPARRGDPRIARLNTLPPPHPKPPLCKGRLLVPCHCEEQSNGESILICGAKVKSPPLLRSGSLLRNMKITLPPQRSCCNRGHCRSSRTCRCDGGDGERRTWGKSGRRDSPASRRCCVSYRDEPWTLLPSGLPYSMTPPILALSGD